MQQLNRAMTTMARVLHAIDNNPVMTGVSDQMVDAVEEMRDTFFNLKATYPKYASDQNYNISVGSGGPGLVIVGPGQAPPVTVVEESSFPSVIVIDEEYII